jgi:tetratricopeptide (TPR) repeat protein
MARLSHPGIVPVLDYGAVEQDDAARSFGKLTAGSPYFVMKRAHGGTLKEHPRVQSFDELERLLVAILEALAHAHARGVVHRDIKPSNVLLDGTGREETPMLSDFGIAYAVGPGDEPEASGAAFAGTPWYMAPEQILGRAREQGPWTDLYSVGCLAFKLATGRPPFRGKDRIAVCRAQCLAPIPRIAPPFPIPLGIHDILDVLLAKRPESRFRSAADVIRALAALEGAPRIAPTLADYDTLDDASQRAHELTFVDAAPAGALATAEPLTTPADFPRPSFPSSWIEVEPYHRPDIGLGLFGLRPIPLVGRASARDALWKRLGLVFETGRPGVVILRGPSGLGKSHLARWLSERADELGVATPLGARFTRTPGAVDGLVGMLASHLRTRGLEGDELWDQVHFSLATEPAEDLDAHTDEISRLLSHVRTDGDDKPEERWAVIVRALSRLSKSRPVLVTLDDVHHAGDALGFVQHVLRTRETTPLSALFLLTVDANLVLERVIERDILTTLADDDAVATIDVEALTDDEHLKLVVEQLGLSPAFGGEVANRTRGNPLYAVQLVSDLVHRGLIEPSPHGLLPAGAAAAALLADLRDVWSERVLLLLADMEGAATAERAIEIAACLGHAVDEVEWHTACLLGNSGVPERLRDAAEARGLVVPTDDGFSFVHEMLRERLETRARDAGRLRSHHEAIAAMLGALYPEADGRTLERRGRHLVMAELHEEALTPLLGAIDARIRSGELAEARELLSLRRANLSAIGVGATDRRSLENTVREAEAHAVTGALEETERLLDSVELMATRGGHRDLVGTILWLRAGVAQKRADLGTAIATFARAERALREAGEARLAARCGHGLAECEKLRGDLEAAGHRYQTAIERFSALDDLLYQGRSEIGLADIRRRQGDLDTAETLARSGLAHVRVAQNRHAVATALNGLGDIARLRGRVSYAETHYREALRLLDELDSDDGIIVRLNLALTLLDRGEFGEAARVLLLAERALLSASRGFYRVFVHAALLSCEAAAGDANGWNARERDLRATLDESGLVDDDLGRCLVHAAEQARTVGWPERARSAWRLAAEQWRRLGRKTEAADAERNARV